MRTKNDYNRNARPVAPHAEVDITHLSPHTEDWDHERHGVVRRASMRTWGPHGAYSSLHTSFPSREAGQGEGRRRRGTRWGVGV